MGKLFSGLSTDGMEKLEDRLGGGRHIFTTDVYENVTVKLAYAGQYDSKAQYVTIIFDIEGQELEISETITNKQGENFYVKDGKKNQLPGFATVNDIILTVTGSELSDQDTEERQIEVWSSEEKKKVRQARDVLVDMIGKTASIAVRRILKNKQKKNDSTGKYEDIADEITVNDVAKSFHPESRRTVAEIKAGKTEAMFIGDWKEKWGGKEIDQRSIKEGKTGTSGSGAPPKSSGAEAKPKTSLFAN
jgi:hypothetical protein